jgi:hypothetical protein
MGTSQEPSCNTCLKPENILGSPLMRCAKCKTALYCSQTCQVLDWKKGHKEFCNANKEAHEEGLKVLEKAIGSKATPTEEDGLDAVRAIIDSEFGAGTSSISKLSYTGN